MRKQGSHRDAETAGEIPAGYKQTPLGVIPEDWTTPELRTILRERKRRNRDLSFGKDAVLSVSGEKGVTNQIALLGRSFAGISVAEYHVVEHGDLVYTKSPLKANPYGIIKQNKGTAGIVSTLYAVYSCEDITLGAFLDYYFSDDRRLNNYLRPLVKRGAKNDMKINNDEVLHGIIALPSRPEVRRIVEFLSACDRVIENKQKLLEAKKRRKRALLQALFDPKDGIRISKFFGPWKSETLRGIGNFEKGHGITNSQCLSGDCPCVKYGDIYVCYDTHFSKAQSHTTEPVFRESLRVEAGSLLFTCSGEEPLDIGKCVVYMGTEPIAVGGDILVFHSYKHDPLFLAYQQQTSPLIRQKASLAKGQSIFHIHLPEIQGLQVCVPPTIEEERAIAQTLLTADREIDGLAREIDAWKEKRKALSQLLLSGKVRV